jgi:hypothetical protein
MNWLAVDEISHRILPDAEPVIESCFNSVTTVVARNSVVFHGNCITVAHLRASTLGKTVLVPYYAQQFSFHAFFKLFHWTPVFLSSGANGSRSLDQRFAYRNSPFIYSFD